MQLGRVLYNRESESCTSCFPRMALVHSVESFEDPLLILLRDSDSGVLYSNTWISIILFYRNSDLSIRLVVFYRVFDDIVDHLIEDLSVAVYLFMGSYQ